MATSKDNPYVAIEKQLRDTLAADKATTEAGAITEEQKAYIARMQAEKKLGTSLAQQGITGGASESALLGTNVGYQNQKNVIQKNKLSTLTDLQRNADASLLTNNTQSAQWEAQKQAQDESRFANTITGYDTIQKVDKAMEAAVTAGEDWKLGYLRAQRAALVEQAKAKTTTTSGGGGGGDDTPKISDPVGGVSAVSSQGIPYSSGGISGTQGGMTSTYYPTRPLNPYLNQPSRGR